ncbi:MerR family transcriptional regulator [Streptomyces sp. NPDC051064]|uniref:MerR family transcriptional regulator n=1 Tax=Streptomyces sp. NPDC051064 TaxID=3365641 RepID=UPI00378F783A
MDDDTLHSIGELARRTGLTVKTIRFYSDRGIVTPTDRSPAGYRLYAVDAVARLDLVRTLRDLGLGLPTIRKVMDREISLPEVAAAHAEALAVQIRTLRQAWMELAELSQDPDFRAGLRRTAEDHAAERASGGTTGPHRDLVGTVRDLVGPALKDGIEPASHRADPVVAALAAHYARVLGRPDDVELRHRLLTRLEGVSDARRERYFQLLAVINRWSAPERLTPVLEWSVEALRARVRR